MNKIIIMGRLTADPEYKTTANGIGVCKFYVAVPRPWRKDSEETADFFTVTAWRNTAEFVSKYFTKGKMILVTGALRNNNYTGSDGVKRYENYIVAESVEFTGDKQRKDDEPSDLPEIKNTTIEAEFSLEDFEEVISNDEMPF